MSRLAFVSDIHSNLHALTAVLAEVERAQCDGIYCLGDQVGYGARPAECLALLRDVGAQALTGNHDAMVTGREKGEGFNENSKIAAALNRDLLSKEDLVYLAGLPDTIRYRSDVLLCHGSPNSYNQYTYFKVDFSLTVDQMRQQGLTRCFLGHTHHPVLYDGELLRYDTVTEFPLEKERAYIINPGSVGQPRDGDVRASFATWDDQAEVLRFHRVEYDVAGAREDILAAGLPERLGDRLLEGK